MGPLLLTVILASLTPCPATSEKLPDELISSLQNSASYLEKAYKDLNLDGIVGFQFLKEWINHALKKWEKDPQMKSQWQQLADIRSQVSSLIKKTMDVLKETDSVYYEDFSTVIKDGFFKPPSSWTQTDPSLTYNQNSIRECFELVVSNECIMHILGKGEAPGTDCVIPPFCRSNMTLPDCRGYSLSHQMFYFMIAKGKGCTNHLFKVETPFYTARFCANMMKFNLKVEDYGYPFENLDLFMENIMFCGLCGFSDFLKPKWLKKIISWQDPDTGCFRKIKESNVKSDREKHHIPRRVKRREKTLDDGCLCHMGSVAIGALGPFLR
ncbi:UPF0764 protein C16orf89 homolog [Lissotriton helveticus]